MLTKKSIVFLSFLIIIAFTIGDFFFFKISAGLAFILHNLLALAVGTGLIYISCKFLRKSYHKSIFYFNIFVGLWMLSAHVTKLMIGNCV